MGEARDNCDMFGVDSGEFEGVVMFETVVSVLSKSDGREPNCGRLAAADEASSSLLRANQFRSFEEVDFECRSMAGSGDIGGDARAWLDGYVGSEYTESMLMGTLNALPMSLSVWLRTRGRIVGAIAGTCSLLNPLGVISPSSKAKPLKLNWLRTGSGCCSAASRGAFRRMAEIRRSSIMVLSSRISSSTSSNRLRRKLPERRTRSDSDLATFDGSLFLFELDEPGRLKLFDRRPENGFSGNRSSIGTTVGISWS
jgi:hypothetical protein